ncbi:MerR family transcriptional regulator [Kineococcus sp. LSe6-4]|uniref:MerR family transcriptional regulator n=1 Tax=Kineococcus halophytocola TaxID=3234027 RepID=A0ABV4H6E2_9ACTN
MDEQRAGGPPVTTMGIAEVVDRLGISAHTLRYYETAGLLVDPPGRDGSGHRCYTDAHLRWITMVQRLRATGMPVRGVRAYADLCRAGAGNEDARLTLLYAHRDQVRAQLAEVATHLEAIETKIALYEGSVAGASVPA